MQRLIILEIDESKRAKKIERDLRELFLMLNHSLFERKLKIKKIVLAEFSSNIKDSHGHRGIYVDKDKLIAINTKQTYGKIKEIFCHELAHAYQNQVLMRKTHKHGKELYRLTRKFTRHGKNLG